MLCWVIGEYSWMKSHLKLSTNDCSFLLGLCYGDANRYGIFHLSISLLLSLPSIETPWISMTRKWQLKQFDYALVTQTWKKHLREACKCLTFSVDQVGLEPTTSRLWVCCSDQLSYKSKIWVCKNTSNKWEIQTFLQKSTILNQLFSDNSTGLLVTVTAVTM